MKCTKCGGNISQNQAFCSTCGAPVEKQQQVYEDNNKNGGKGGVPVWLVIVLILVIVAVMLVVMFVLLNNKENSKSNGKEETVSNNVIESNETKNKVSSNETENKVSSNTTKNNVSGGSASQGNQATSHYKVKFNGFQVKVPDNLIYSVREDALVVTDEGGNWLAEIAIQQGSVSSLKESDVASFLRTKGVTVGATKETKIAGQNAIVAEVTNSGINMIVAYVRINSMYMGCIVLYCSDYQTYDYNALDTAGKILTTVQVDEQVPSTSTNLSTDDFSKFSEYLKQ